MKATDSVRALLDTPRGVLLLISEVSLGPNRLTRKSNYNIDLSSLETRVAYVFLSVLLNARLGGWPSTS